MELTAITYIGKGSGFVAKVGKNVYEFEWQKSLGVGTRADEIPEKHAKILSKWKDRRGKKLFIIE